jgi:hypothetical protein
MLDSGIAQAVSPANSKSDTNYFKASSNFGAECNHFPTAGSSYFRLTHAPATLCLPQLAGILGKSGVIAAFFLGRHDRGMRLFNRLTAGSALILRPFFRFPGAGGAARWAGLWLISNLLIYLTGFLKCRNRPKAGKNSQKEARRKYEAGTFTTPPLTMPGEPMAFADY